MEINTNYQPNKKLRHFQKVIVQDLCIKQLNKWIDELDWEIEKKDTIISTKDEEIAKLQKSIKVVGNIYETKKKRKYTNNMK